MDFTYSPKVVDLQQRMHAFFDQSDRLRGNLCGELFHRSNRGNRCSTSGKHVIIDRFTMCPPILA